MAGRDPVIIVGGGLSGMTALYENLKNGVPTVLYEKEPHRSGGVIRTLNTGNRFLDMGAELIDSTHTALIGLCKEMNLPLVDTLAEEPGAMPKDASGSGEENAYYLNSKTGRLVSDTDLLNPSDDPSKVTGLFISLAREIQADFAAMSKTYNGEDWLDTEFNRKLDKMTAEDYLAEKMRQLKKSGDPVHPSVIAAIENAYQCENGRDLRDISAFVFINQLGQGQSGEGIKFNEGFSVFGGSDERYKVPGGTANLTAELQKKCEEMAQKMGFPAPIRYGHNLQSIERDEGGKTILNFRAHSKTVPVEADYVISALPAPALGRVLGVENLGLTPEQVDLMASLQFTHSSKVFFEVNGKPWEDFTIKGVDGHKRRVTDSNGNFYGGTIKECWVSGDDTLTKDGTSWITCLIGGEENDKYQDHKALVAAAKQEYARILGKSEDELFTKDGRNLGTALLYAKTAGGGIGCYASPGIAQAIPLMQMSEELRQGTVVDGKPAASFVGTWLASVDRSNQTPAMNVGFMEVGVENAIDASARCVEYMMSRKHDLLLDTPVNVTVTANPGLAEAFNTAPLRVSDVAGQPKQGEKAKPVVTPVKLDA